MRNLHTIPNGAVAIEGEHIVAVGTTQELQAGFSARHTFDAANHAVCPGFVDAHTHVVYAGDRIDEFERRIRGDSYLDILAAGGGINSTVRHVRAATVAQLVAETRPRLDTMLRLGTTSVEVKTGYGLTTADEIKMLDAIEQLDASHPIDLIPTFLGAHAIPPEFAGRADDYTDCVIEEQIPAAAAWYKRSSFARRNIPFFIDVFCERKAFSLDQSKRVLQAGIRHGMRAKAHVDEFFNLDGARMAISMKAQSIDHLDVFTPEQIQAAANSETICVVLPAVNFNSGSDRFANARALIDSGAALALATDMNPGSAPCFSIPLTMAIACRYQKLLPSEALHAATINAACAVGLAEQAGSIEPGKLADVLILKSRDYRNLVYEFGNNPVESVIKRGKIVAMRARVNPSK
jgi:imidazolonepropionase